MAKSAPKKQSKDLALLQGPTADGEGARIIRCRNGTLSAGEVRPVREGQTLNSQELLRLRPLKGSPAICEVEVVHEPASPAQGTRSGPAQVATDTYRRNWNQVFASGTRQGPDEREHEPSEGEQRTRPRNWSLN